jgi:hypothetical protein
MTVPGTTPDVDALDCFLPAYGLQPTYFLVPPPPDVTCYFSVTSATKHQVPASWLGAAAPSGANVFSTTWNPITQRWSCPSVYVAYNDLLLSSNDDVDALAVDAWQSAGRRFLLFSTKNATLSQLRFADLLASGVVVKVDDYRYADGQKVADDIGLDFGDDIDGICVIDPCNTYPGRSPLFACMHGVPNTPAPAFGEPLPAGAIRRFQDDKQVLTTYTVGGPRSPATSFSYLLMSDSASQPTFYLPIVLLPAGSGGAAYPGSPTVFDIPVPQVLPPGLHIGVHWYDLELNPQTIHAGFSVAVKF